MSHEQLKRIEVHIPLSTRGSLVFAKVTGEELKYFGLTKKALKFHPTLNLKLIPESAIIATEGKMMQVFLYFIVMLC